MGSFFHIKFIHKSHNKINKQFIQVNLFIHFVVDYPESTPGISKSLHKVAIFGLWLAVACGQEERTLYILRSSLLLISFSGVQFVLPIVFLN